MLDLAVRNVLYKEDLCDLLVHRGRIESLARSGEVPAEAGQEVDGRRCRLLPGLVDAHAHFREPGFEYKEDITSGLAAAAAGGFARVMVMANTDPVNDNGSITGSMLRRAKESRPDGPFLHPVGALTRGLRGTDLSPMHELAEAGCVAFSNDGVPVRDSELFRHALEYSSDLGLRVIDHCEDPHLSAGGVLNEGAVSARLGLKGQPTVAESLQVARGALLAGYLDVPVHLAHISCRESVEIIAWAKARGVPLTAETCPHYLLWDESLAAEYDTLAKVNPPLRTPDDVQAVRQGLREGIIDILVTDHAPHAGFEKDVPFAEAPNGIAGMETALPLTWSLVRSGELATRDLLRAWCRRPAEIFGFPVNSFSPGDPADFLLWDEEAVWEVSPENLCSKGKNTPCIGKRLTGRMRAHFLRGRPVFGD
jgi:dihydroorotase